MKIPARMTREMFTLNSFQFQKRGVFSKDSGFEWRPLPDERVSADVRFRLEKDPCGSLCVQVRHVTTADDTQEESFDYGVNLDYTPCRYGGRWWFLCPHAKGDGNPCGRRCRLLYMQPDGGRFTCRQCGGLSYVSTNRNHNRIYKGFVKPIEDLLQTGLKILQCRGEQKHRALSRRAEAAQQRIEDFLLDEWAPIVSRVVEGKAGPRDQGYFDELVGLVLDDQVREFVEAAFRDEGNSQEFPEIDAEELFQRISSGLLDMKQYAEFDRVLRAAHHPDAMPRLLLAALVCDEVGACLDDEIGVLSSFAAREWVKSCVQDPEALMRLLLRFQRKETEDTERPLADDHEQTDDDERTS